MTPTERRDAAARAASSDRVARAIRNSARYPVLPCAAHHCSIYRDAAGYDCTNNGASSKHTRAVLYVDLQPDELPDPLPNGVAAFRLETKPAIGTEPYPRAVPVGETRWTMFGGNFLWSCDSRFRQQVSERPIPIHDRVEG